MLLDALLDRGNALKRGIPSVLEFARHQAFGRIDGFVPACRQRRLEARFFEFSAEGPPDIRIDEAD